MDTRDQIIRLGKCLAVEAKSGYADAGAGGLAAFLERWRGDSNGAAEHPVVEEVLRRLDGYAALPMPERCTRIDRSLEELRALFRAPSTASPAPRAAKNPVPAPTLEPDMLLSAVPGIGPSMARAFARLGLRTVEDMLYHFPHRYDDYSSRDTIASLTLNAEATVVGEIVEIKTFGTRTGREGVNIVLNDDTGVLQVSFFGQKWLSKQLHEGQRIVVSGKVGSFNGRLKIDSPKWEPYREDELTHAGRLVPVHPLTKGLYERNVRTLIKRIVDAAAPRVPDYLPAEVRERARLVPLPRALQQVHFPDDQKQRKLAEYRLGFDEFLFIQLGVLMRKKLWQGEAGYPLRIDETVHAAFLQVLPFSLTGAQERTLQEIFADVRRPIPMARLVQGDVGSGKTVVAAAALVQAIANGFQGALMAPTEILAEQHYRGLKKLLQRVAVPRIKPEPARDDDWKGRVDAEQLHRMAEIKRLLGMTEEEDQGGAGIRVALLTGSLKGKERRRVLEGVAQGEVDLVIGTHALIQEGVQYNSLGLAVIDEQHRFGVEQRERLKGKGHHPHLLVMTATPIPRSLALSIYGDLDASVVDEMPPGRIPIKTRWISKAEVEKAHRHVRKEIAAGRQAFVICPLVEESEKLELASAVETQQYLQHEVFPDLNIGLVHGRMSQAEKDVAMADFRDRTFHILVATAVVEVGIDIPNATVIMILGAERFGLAQLHQFRGRVGRGEHQSYCIVVSDIENEQTQERLSAFEATNDGFALADVDLKLRGPGEFFGRRQSGTPDLKMAELGDIRLLHAARAEAEQILARDPTLEHPEHALLATKVAAFWEGAGEAS
ncbi:MAG: RecG [uncultured Chloroflexia bacterium]|uniref:ATP-dependent DNA helicase RecG n=1 Tax=uncultured Chloroflexia bacterium TaxID=1672391 RepID=A0A6J4I4I8_9CHLR|nr:MAG: RecG [uncultured Chloroflexia bacterium]